jgi:ElaB/YqjD/DUF883 family membrane-anchored ribosome-binding protein
MTATSDIRRVGETAKSQFSDVVDQASGLAASATSEIRRAGETVKSQLSGVVDQASGVASAAADAVRERSSRVAESAQEFYDELEGDSPANKLRHIVAEYPFASLVAAAAIGFLLSRTFDDRS